jgi:hypothetical protein
MDFLLKAKNIDQQLSQDSRLNSSHVSLYLALLLVWEQNSFVNPFRITRERLMSLSKIGSLATYHRCIKQLEEFGYIRYTPTFNSFIGSSVQII